MRGGVSSTQGNIWQKKREEEWNYEHERTTIFLRLATYICTHTYIELGFYQNYRHSLPCETVPLRLISWARKIEIGFMSLPPLSPLSLIIPLHVHVEATHGVYIRANIVSDTSLYEP